MIIDILFGKVSFCLIFDLKKILKKILLVYESHKSGDFCPKLSRLCNKYVFVFSHEKCIFSVGKENSQLAKSRMALDN